MQELKQNFERPNENIFYPLLFKGEVMKEEHISGFIQLWKALNVHGSMLESPNDMLALVVLSGIVWSHWV